MHFCVDVITPPENFRAPGGVLRASSLVVIADAYRLADDIRQKAHDDAQAILEQAHTEALSVAYDTEHKTLERAQHLLQSIEQEHTTFMQRAQEVVIDLAHGLFDRLVSEMTPRERIGISLKRLLQEAPPRLVNTQLRVHPDDVAALPEVEWEIKPDASLTPGTCRLEATNGEWCADFSAAVSALKSALTKAAQQTCVVPDPVDDSGDAPE